jgi:hypothetical protein
MASNATQISQPGWTGNLSAADRESCAADTLVRRSIGHRSMTASSCTLGSPVGSLIVCTSSPVSVGLRTIETGGKELAQRQSLRGLQRFTLTAKVPTTRLFGGHLLREIAACVSSAIDAHVERPETR